MARCKNLIYSFIFLFLIQNVFAQMQMLTDTELGDVTGQKGIKNVMNLVSFSEAFASATKEAKKNEDLDKALPFTEAFKNKLKKNQNSSGGNMTFAEAFQRAEKKDLGDGWVYTKAHIHWDEISLVDAFSASTGINTPLKGTVFDDIMLYNVDIHMEGKLKIEFRP